MYNIAICIPTYKRPVMLKKLILSIIGNQIDKTLIRNINIIVVDNDIERTAEGITNELKTVYADRFTLIYHNYPKKGLSYVRNEIFRKALECSPDYILCIDDDEYATTEWIMQLLLSITTNKGDIAMGPVIPEIESPVSSAISYWFKSPLIINNQELDYFESGNFIICTKFLVKNDLEFDPRFNLTGAEDSYFGVMALKKGAKIFRAGGAVAYETISENRATLNWLIKRFYRGALTYSHILILEKKYLKILKKLLVNVVNIIAGIISLILLPFQSKYRYWGILKISESAGSFAGMAGIKYHEYEEDNKS
jgi:succinoglycan biosynthesis protein ExoM